MEAEFINMTFKHRKTKNVFEWVNLINGLLKKQQKEKSSEQWTTSFLLQSQKIKIKIDYTE